MKNYRTFSIVAAVSVAAFSAFILAVGGGMIEGPKVKPVVNAAPAAFNARPVETPQNPSPAMLSSDTFVPSQRQQPEQESAPQGDFSRYSDGTFRESDDYTWTDSPGPVTVSWSPSITAATVPTESSSNSSSGGSSGTTSGGGGSSSDSADSSGSTDTSSDTQNGDSTTPPDSDTTPSTGGGGGSANPFSNVTVTVLPSVQRILQDDISAPGTTIAELYCAKNETEAFQIIVTNKSNITLPDIELYVSDWQDPSGTKTPIITLFREHYVRIDTPSYGLNSQPGWYPDALIPFVDPYTGKPITTGLYRAAGVSVGNKKNQGYWVDVRVDADVPDGTYTCSILVTSSDQAVAEIPVTLTVWNFALPTQRQFITWWYGFYNVHQYYGLQSTLGENYLTFLKRYQDMAYAHGIYPNPQFMDAGVSRNGVTGEMTFTSRYHSQMTAFVQKYGKGVIWITPSYIFSDPENWVLHSDTKIKNTLAGYNALSAAHPEYGQYVVYIDEAFKPEREEAVIAVKRLMNATPAPRIKMLLTGSTYAYDIEDTNTGEKCADIWVLYGSDVIEEGLKRGYTLEELVNDFLARPGKTVWTNHTKYYTDASLLAQRDWAWYGYTFGAEGGFGWLLSVLTTHNVDPWIQARTYINPAWPDQIYNGRNSYIYPGNASRVGISGIGGPIPSMRLKTWRKACEDFEYFKLAESLTDKDTIDAIVSGVVQGYYTYAAPTQYEAARKQIAELILEHIH